MAFKLYQIISEQAGRGQNLSAFVLLFVVRLAKEPTTDTTPSLLGHILWNDYIPDARTHRRIY